MSLEACPKCGYAVSLADRRCGHCASAAHGPVTRPTRNGKLSSAALLIAVTVAIAIYLATRYWTVARDQGPRINVQGSESSQVH